MKKYLLALATISLFLAPITYVGTKSDSDLDDVDGLRLLDNKNKFIGLVLGEQEIITKVKDQFVSLILLNDSQLTGGVVLFTSDTCSGQAYMQGGGLIVRGAVAGDTLYYPSKDTEQTIIPRSMKTLNGGCQFVSVLQPGNIPQDGSPTLVHKAKSEDFTLQKVSPLE